MVCEHNPTFSASRIRPRKSVRNNQECKHQASSVKRWKMTKGQNNDPSPKLQATNLVSLDTAFDKGHTDTLYCQRLPDFNNTKETLASLHEKRLTRIVVDPEMVRLKKKEADRDRMLSERATTSRNPKQTTIFLLFQKATGVNHKIKFPAPRAHTPASRLACPKSMSGMMAPHRACTQGSSSESCLYIPCFRVLFSLLYYVLRYIGF